MAFHHITTKCFRLTVCWRLALAAVLVLQTAGCSEKHSGGFDLPTGDLSEARNAATSRTPLVFPEFSLSRQQYAGSDSCLECHRDVHEVYSHHPMANSTTVLSDDPESQLDEPVSFDASTGKQYRVSRDEDGNVWHHELASDSQGNAIYDQAVKMDLAMGSGVHGKSYLYFSKNRMMQSPIAWYSESEQWDLAPGYDGMTSPRFERLVAHDCLHCHIGQANVVPKTRYTLQDPAFGEMGISCERCHGPSQSHVDFHRLSELERPEEDPVLKLMELPPDRLDAICYQCHMQGQRRIPHYGADETSFRPGMSMNDVWTLFLKLPGDDSIPIVSHGEQMLQSKCYQASGEMGCVTCHDPHTRPAEDNLTQWYRAKCLSCHESEDNTDCALDLSKRLTRTAEDSCIVCHMPKASAKDVPHTAHTDHSIPADATRRTLDADLQPLMLGEPSAGIDQSNRQRARGIFLAEQAYSRGDRKDAEEAIRLLKPVLESIPDDYQSAEAIGRAFETIGDMPAAIAAWEHGLSASPEDELLLLLLAGAYHAGNDARNAEPLYQTLVKMNPQRSLYRGRLTHVLGMQGQLRDSIRSAELSLKLNPSLIQAHQWLVVAYDRLGDMTKSQYHQRMVERLRGVPGP